MPKSMVAILSCLIAILLVTTPGISGSEDFDFERILKSRPFSQHQLFDYVGVLGDISEYSENYLKHIRELFSIEAVILALPSIGSEETLKKVAKKILQSPNGEMGIMLL